MTYLKGQERLRFLEWVRPLQTIRTHGWVDLGGWYYFALVDYNIVGSGPTRVSAVREAMTLLQRYLVREFMDGKALDETQRPSPWHARVRFMLRRKWTTDTRLVWADPTDDDGDDAA